MDAKVTRALRGALTVGELIAELQRLPADSVPVFVCDYGDYSHTQQALPIRQVTDPAEERYSLRASAYSQSGVALAEPPEPDDDDPDNPAPEPDSTRFVILNAARG